MVTQQQRQLEMAHPFYTQAKGIYASVKAKAWVGGGNTAEGYKHAIEHLMIMLIADYEQKLAERPKPPSRKRIYASKKGG